MIHMYPDSILFPQLGILFPHIPETVSVFGFEIAIYGIIMAVSIFLGMGIALMVAEKTGQDPDNYVDLTLIGVVTGILGARIYYVVFSWDYYKDHLLEIFNLRRGGLAFYGGAAGAVLAAVLYARHKKLKVGLVLDTACTGLVFGQIIGRFGNFVNREAFGGYTDNVFSMILPLSAVHQDQVTDQMLEHAVTISDIRCIQVHPTFLYEIIWNFFVFVFLLIFTFAKLKKVDGEIFLLYLLLYGCGRFWIEALRSDQLLIWGTDIPVSRLLAFLLALSSGVMLIVIHLKKNYRS